ncbi:MAG: hypothetical protein JSR82_13645 [Verrucomicrobia bacterium]|nr:hypothetical protein [Verrucomicrobiota bacterium]
MASAIPTPLLTPLLPEAPRRPSARRYWPLVITLVIFNLALVLTVLALNYLSSYRLDENSRALALAGRQRALLERIPLALLQLREARGKGADYAAQQGDLQATVEQFEAILTAFDRGGEVRGEGRIVAVRALTPGDARDLLAQASFVWGPYRDRLLPVARQRGGVSDEQLTTGLTAAREHNAVMLGLLGDLAARMEESARRETTRLRRYQMLAGAGALLAFGALLYVFMARVRQSERALDAFADRLQHSNEQLQISAGVLATAKQEADLILTTVHQGLLLLDPTFLIGRQYSDELRRLFRREDLAGCDFRDLLRPLLHGGMFRPVCDYLDLLFNAAKKERALARINPLARIELTFSDPTGVTECIYEFAFRRILDGERIIRLLVSVRDVTPEVRQEQAQRAEEARRERQLELLLGILHLDPKALEDFLGHARRELARVDSAFRLESAVHQGTPMPTPAPVTEATLRARLHDILAAVHNVKGNASVLALATFERAAHEFEDEIRSLLARPELTNTALMEVEDRLEEFRASLDEGNDLAGRLRAFARSEGGDPIVDSLASFVHATALKHGRNVRIEAQEFRSADIPAEHRLLVHDLLIQLARNAVVHGIEDPKTRAVAGKPPLGLLRLSGRLDDRGDGRSIYRLQVEDDGGGIKVAAVRERAIALGLVSREAAEQLTDEQLHAFIFEPGFSTATTETTHSGHGAGLNFVRRRVIDDLGGGISVSSEPGRSLRLSIVLPIQPAPTASGANGHLP